MGVLQTWYLAYRWVSNCFFHELSYVKGLDPPFLSLFSMSFVLPLSICLVSWIPRIPVLCTPGVAIVHQRLSKIVYGASMGIAQTKGEPNILHIIMIDDMIFRYAGNLLRSLLQTFLKQNKHTLALQSECVVKGILIFLRILKKRCLTKVFYHY